MRYTVDRKPPHRIDPASKHVIIEWASNGHNGGDLAFGNDGYLYVTSGDGSSGSDAHLTGQTLDDLLAGMLRIDVDHPDAGRNYGVPKDNPFVDRPGARPEIWAYGLRNPWRLSFDRKSGQLWVGKNGQDLWEQVYLIKKGGNYGWSVSEGSHVFHGRPQGGPRPDLCRRPPSTRTARPARSPAAGSTAAPACPTWSGPTSTATGPPARSGASSTTARRPSGTASWSTPPSTSPASAPTTPASCTSSTRRAGSTASSRRPRPTGPRGRSRPG